MSVKKDIATLEGHLEPLNHEAAGIKFDPTGTSSSADNVQDALVDALTASGTGDVTGTPPSTDKAIARYLGITGKVIQNSKTVVQDGGSIEAQAFVMNRLITDTVHIGPDQSCLASSISIEDGELQIEEDGELVLV